MSEQATWSALGAIAGLRGAAPILLTAILISVTWFYHLQFIHQGDLFWLDEFYTLDRSTGFSRHEDWWTVYSSNAPSFIKPPLQYWMSALLLEAGVDQLVALRLPSMLFSLGTLISVAVLTAMILPDKPWAIPASVLLLASSTEFWRYATSAMLESGATFLASLALTCVLIAGRSPIWWYGAAIAIGLGALQKAPIGLLLVVAILAAQKANAIWPGHTRRRRMTGHHAWIAISAAVVLVLAWPIFQAALHGDEVWKTFNTQTIERFQPGRTFEHTRTASELYSLIVGSEAWLRIPGMLALFWLPFHLRRMDLMALAAVFLLFTLTMLLASGKVYDRYTLTFLPYLCVALAALAMSVFSRQWLAIALICVVSAASGGPLKPAEALRLEQPMEITEQIDVLKAVGRTLRPDEMLVICNWEDSRHYFGGAVSFYASNDRPFRVWYRRRAVDRDIRKKVVSQKIRGVCSKPELDAISNRFSSVTIVKERGSHVIWTADVER